MKDYENKNKKPREENFGGSDRKNRKDFKGKDKGAPAAHKKSGNREKTVGQNVGTRENNDKKVNKSVKKTENTATVQQNNRNKNRKPQSSKGGKNLRIIFLGGIGEIGKNMTALEYGDDILVIDAGMCFPSLEELPGIDYVIPDYNYLIENKNKVRGIAITHGHEDHIGAMPYFMKDFDVPVYASRFTLAIVANKLKETELNLKTAEQRMHATVGGDIVKIGCFSVEFVPVTHSTAGSFALKIDTPRGVVFHTGDFKIDYTPVDGRKTDLARIAEIGREGVKLLMMDSTNAERQGYSMSEKNVGATLDSLFSQNVGRRIIVATFASNIHRVQQIMNCAAKYGRKVAFSGRSMINITEVARQIKEIKYDPEIVVDIEKSDKIPYDRMCIICTGSQGEPMSALRRMATGDFKKVKICDTDTIILSSSPIPGNEKPIYNVINSLCKMGARVIYQSLEQVHVSGHAFREELKLMFTLVNPKYFLPVHGEYRHLLQSAELVQSLGFSRDNVLLPELGGVIELDAKNGIKRGASVKSGSVLIDGSRLSEWDEEVMSDRKKLSGDGVVIALVTVDYEDGVAALDCELTIKGMTAAEDVEKMVKKEVMRVITQGEWLEKSDDQRKADVGKAIRKLLLNNVKKRPMILPIIVE